MAYCNSPNGLPCPCNGNTEQNTDSASHIDPNTHTDNDVDHYSDCHTNTNRDPFADTYGQRDSFTDPNHHTDGYTNTNQYSTASRKFDLRLSDMDKRAELANR